MLCSIVIVYNIVKQNREAKFKVPKNKDVNTIDDQLIRLKNETKYHYLFH